MPIAEKAFTTLSPSDLQPFVNSYSPVWIGYNDNHEELVFITKATETAIHFKPFLSVSNEEYELSVKEYGSKWFAYFFEKEQEEEDEEMNNE